MAMPILFDGVTRQFFRVVVSIGVSGVFTSPPGFTTELIPPSPRCFTSSAVFLRAVTAVSHPLELSLPTCFRRHLPAAIAS